MTDPRARTHQESITIAVASETVYDLVSNITLTGEWSPVCTSCWWDDKAEAGQVGAWFIGHNELPDRAWETRSQVVAAASSPESWEAGSRGGASPVTRTARALG